MALFKGLLILNDATFCLKVYLYNKLTANFIQTAKSGCHTVSEIGSTSCR